MITTDISNIWGEVSLPDLLASEKLIFDAHKLVTDGGGRGEDYRGWVVLPDRVFPEEVAHITAAADRIREMSDVFVVCGIGGSYLGARGH